MRGMKIACFPDSSQVQQIGSIVKDGNMKGVCFKSMNNNLYFTLLIIKLPVDNEKRTDKNICSVSEIIILPLFYFLSYIIWINKIDCCNLEVSKIKEGKKERKRRKKEKEKMKKEKIYTTMKKRNLKKSSGLYFWWYCIEASFEIKKNPP